MIAARQRRGYVLDDVRREPSDHPGGANAGITLTYSYDTAGDVTAIADLSGATTSMTYNAANEVTSKTYSDGTNTLRVDYTWDHCAGDVLTETGYSDLAGTTGGGLHRLWLSW